MFAGDTALRLAPARRTAIHAVLQASRRHLAGNDPGFFAQGLPSSQHWRLFSDFRGTIAYLDIETTGMAFDTCPITTIAVYDGTAVNTYVQGQNLHEFSEAIRRYKVLVTYNGKCFDLPFIAHYFGQPLDQAHIDLRFVLAGLGIKGGLKRCEAQLGIDRGPLTDVDGLFAVLLWREYARTGNPAALETLLAYNVEDTLNLEYLMVAAYNAKLQQTPFFDRYALPLPSLHDQRNPFRADADLVARLRPEHAFLSSLSPRH